MLSELKLDNVGYDRLIQHARSSIPRLMREWTDYNDHDPGITTIQVFAWLTDVLNYYIDATGEEHKLKYLKLLGIEPERGVSEGILVADCDNGGDFKLLKGTKFIAGDNSNNIIFEAKSNCFGKFNKMLCIKQLSNDIFTDLTPFAGKDGQFAVVFSPIDKTAKDMGLFIGFENTLSGKAKIYADIQMNSGRNNFDDNFFLAEYKWEYNDGENWLEAELLGDETGGFLKNGYITLDIKTETREYTLAHDLQPAHYLRAMLVKNEYDVPPRVGKFYMNSFEVTQTDTLSQAVEFIYSGENETEVGYYATDSDHIMVAAETDGEYEVWYEGEGFEKLETKLCDVRRNENQHGSFSIIFNNKKPETGQKIMVVISDVRYKKPLNVGYAKTVGYADERFYLGIEELHEIKIALISGEKIGGRKFTVYEESENLRAENFDAAKFSYNRKTGELIFGNGYNAIQPEANCEIRVITAVTSKFENGNVRENRINSYVFPQDIQITNPCSTVKGCRAKSADELILDIENRVYSNRRAVNKEDYAKIIMATKGLIIDNVNVINGNEYAKFYGGEKMDSVVFAAVKPASEHEERPVLCGPYKKRIREGLESRRLLNTDVRIIETKYVEIAVDGRISLAEDSNEAREFVIAKIREMTDAKIGTRIVYARMFSEIEMLKAVTKINYLSFKASGKHVRKNEQGDMIVAPDAFAYLTEINLDFFV